MTDVVGSRADFLAARARIGAGQVAAVLTMGALHDGHEALLRAARAAADVVVATVFVNPAQFAPGEDFQQYPRSLEADLRRCASTGVDLVWTPHVADVYPSPPRIAVDPGPLGAELEGAARPGHFAGVLLVVAKFLNLLAPAAAYFGEKDYQQLTLVRAMVSDLDLPVVINGVATVRERDGLALSSRNVYLDPQQRAAAPVLARALAAGREAGRRGAAAVLAAARAELRTETRVDVDYLELRDPALRPAPPAGPARLLVAARIGHIRLIDNVAVELNA